MKQAIDRLEQELNAATTGNLTTPHFREIIESISKTYDWSTTQQGIDFLQLAHNAEVYSKYAMIMHKDDIMKVFKGKVTVVQLEPKNIVDLPDKMQKIKQLAIDYLRDLSTDDEGTLEFVHEQTGISNEEILEILNLLGS